MVSNWTTLWTVVTLCFHPSQRKNAGCRSGVCLPEVETGLEACKLQGNLRSGLPPLWLTRKECKPLTPPWALHRLTEAISGEFPTAEKIERLKVRLPDHSREVCIRRKNMFHQNLRFMNISSKYSVISMACWRIPQHSMMFPANPDSTSDVPRCAAWPAWGCSRGRDEERLGDFTITVLYIYT